MPVELTFRAETFPELMASLMEALNAYHGPVTEIEPDLEDAMRARPYTPPAPSKPEPEAAPSPPPLSKRGRPRKADGAAAAPVAPPTQPEPEAEEDEDENGSQPTLETLKALVTSAVLRDPRGGPIRSALPKLKERLGLNLVAEASTEAHRAVLAEFVKEVGIDV